MISIFIYGVRKREGTTIGKSIFFFILDHDSLLSSFCCIKSSMEEIIVSFEKETEPCCSLTKFIFLDSISPTKSSIDELNNLFQNLTLHEHDHSLHTPVAAETEQSPPLRSLMEVEETCGYVFSNKKLLTEAFTHASYTTDGCPNYDHLKNLGKAVLNLLIANHHSTMYKSMARGELTELRDANVNSEALARATLKHGLYKFLLHRIPLLDKKIELFVKGVMEYPSHSYGMIETPKVFADILESLIGAIFVDSGSSIDDTWKVVERFLQPLITPENLMRNAKAKLKESMRVEYKLKKSIAMNRAAHEAYKYLF